MSDAVWKTLLLFESSALNMQTPPRSKWRCKCDGTPFGADWITNVRYICHIWQNLKGQKCIRLHMWSASGAPDCEGLENLAHDKKPFYYLEANECLFKCPSMFSSSVDNRQRLYCLVYYCSWHFCHPDGVLCSCGLVVLPLCQKQPDDITAGTSVFHVMVEKHI